MKKQAIHYPDKNKIKMLFPFDRGLISEIKKIPGRKYHPKDTKFWSAPVSIEAIEKLQRLNFNIDPSLLEWLREKKFSVDQVSADIQIPGLGGELFPFQARGVSFIEARKGRALIGDEMGLGKTVQALAWLQLNPDARPAVIVCPSSLKLNWAKEARKWMDDPKIQVLEGTKPYRFDSEIIIINYAILKDWVDRLIEYGINTVIMDEIHYTKNNKSKRTKATKKLTKKIPHVIGLTGTPIVNRPIEIVNAVQMIDKSVIPNRWHFLHKYCDAKHTGFGWDFSGSSNEKELHQKLTNTLMIRRKKKDVLKDLPDKIRSFIPMSLENRDHYMEAENDFSSFMKNKAEQELKDKIEQEFGELPGLIEINQEKLNEIRKKAASGINILTEIEGLKQLAVQQKMKACLSWINDFLESGEKLVIMATHKKVINELMNNLKGKAVKVDGSVRGVDRQRAVDRFQNDRRCRVFVGNIQAAGVGLTLTAASSIAFMELPWTPGELMQAEDRVHRIGQTDSVSVYYLLAEDTIEEKIAKLIDKKRKVLDSVLDGADPDNTSLITELIKSYQS